MESINYNTLKLIEYLDKLNPQNFGIFFSILLHLLILLFAVGLPNFFGPKDIFVPNIIPIEILNVTDTTNIEKSDIKKDINKKSANKQKKFNSSSNTEIIKQFDVSQNVKTIDNDNQPIIEVEEKNKQSIEQKKTIKMQQKEDFNTKKKVETIKTNKIKPKLKPKPNIPEPIETKSDIQIEPKTKKEPKIEKKETLTKPRSKPKEDFSIASMLKDLRNEKSNNIDEEIEAVEEKEQTGENIENENMILSISEIDLLRQQLSACWNAPAGAVIERGMKVTISSKIKQNMTVLGNSIRIVDTNIPKSNAFYGPITDSAMRTLLNPECTPLKLPKEKYNLWKNLTITFDYSIMKGY